VLPNGFIVSNICTTWGSYDLAFVEGDSTNVVDGQSWSGIVIPQNTFHYVNAMGTPATIPAFTTDLNKSASAPAASTYVAPVSVREVSSSQEVGGG
jgi:hypothetical protein